MDRLKEVFGRRWGCDLSEVQSPNESPLGLQINSVQNPPELFDGSVSSLKLSFNGRWGNYVFQLINMFYLAEKLSCPRLYIHSTDVFPVAAARQIGDISVEHVGHSNDSPGYQLESVFFDMSAFQGLMSELTPNRRRELAVRYVRPLLAQHFAPPTDAVAPGDLIFHIRSGDIFEGPEGQGGSQTGGSLYIQPPLSFYTMVAETVLRRGSRRALIVSENSLNPTIFPLCDALQKMGYAVSVRLQHDLVSDLGYLLAAKHAVFANGTIGIAVALLSDVIADAYFFRRDGTGTAFDVEYYLGDFLRKHYIVDQDGCYIRKGEWRNNAEQRCLMISLPRDTLRWDRAPKVTNIALNKPTKQSSLSAYSKSGESRNAVNGNVDGDFAFHTEFESFPWWEVDFQGLHRIDQILIHNREQVPERAYGLQVFVLGADDEWRMVHDQAGVPFGGRGGKPASVLLGGYPGRALRITLPSLNYLHLCEIEVFSVEWN